LRCCAHFSGLCCDEQSRKTALDAITHEKTLTVPEALFRRKSLPVSMHGCIESMTIKLNAFWARPYTAAHFCGASTHTLARRDDSKGNGALQTNGGGCRPAGDAGWQFLLKFLKDARVVRPSADRAPPWRSREGDPSPFCEGVACLRFKLRNLRNFKVRCNNNFLFWHYWPFCTRMETPSSYEDGPTILCFPD
jgi:hypothetical protein